MKKIINPILKIKDVTREGGRYIYKSSRGKKKILIILKLFITILKYIHLNRCKCRFVGKMVLVKGKNQARLYEFYNDKIIRELGEHTLLQFEEATKLSLKTIINSVPLISKLFFIAFAAFFSTKRRWLNIMILELYKAVDFCVDKHFTNMNTFLCFNDQPVDIAILISALEEKSRTETIVVQHGLILSPKYYFPVNAKQFWAWGNNVDILYGKIAKCKVLTKGRYTTDSTNKSEVFLCSNKKFVNVLIAPSFFHKEIFTVILSAKKILEKCDIKCNVEIKLHPATKLTFILKLWLRLYWPQLNITNDFMENLSSEFDCLFTKNSTSSLDFLLKGKPVYFIETQNNEFPNEKYSFKFEDFNAHFSSKPTFFNLDSELKNKARLDLIKGELNV
ncbi:hypothetical protein HS962_02440 [Pantoea sp. BIGb0393]|uniref:Uncharacterized protein n=1 Tax=Pantoea nemavictus TaxID=2726955 RepID=A0ABU8PMX9_9GAMM|nr:hypothetical protein [Pantoea nemavictus]MBA0035103.1 hypothetical protein [Pantoea nemavictus]